MTEHYIYIRESNGRPVFETSTGSKLPDPFRVGLLDTVGWRSDMGPFEIRFRGDTPLEGWEDKKSQPSTPMGSIHQITALPMKVRPGKKFFFSGKVGNEPIRDPEIQIDTGTIHNWKLIVGGVALFGAGFLTGKHLTSRRSPRQIPPG